MGYLSQIGRTLIGEAMEMPDELVRGYPELAQMRLRRGGLPPLVAGWVIGRTSVAAITLWRTIFFGRGTTVDAPLLLHELRHVEQFRERRTFPLRYIWESIRRGYHLNRYEVDARMYAARRLEQAVRTPPAEEA
jgi:hypothetical protein